jgi:hypothetical protein
MNTIITGYYKKNNLGDDLFEKIALQIFSQKKTDLNGRFFTSK